MESGSLRFTGRSDDCLQALYNQATGTTKKAYVFAILAIVGLSGLVVGIIGLAQVLQAGSLTNQAIVMMATGGGGTLLLIIGAIGLVKNRQVNNLSNNNQTENTEPVIKNDLTITLFKKTEVPGVKNFTVFGAREWEHYYGDVGAEPAYPEGIADILNAQCPFSQDKNTKVKDTHMLVLVPATVGEEALTLNRLDELIQRPKNNGQTTCYAEYSGLVQEAHGATAPSQSYWVLMTRDVIADSRAKSYNEQEKLLSGDKKAVYTFPGALEAAVCILMDHVVLGNKLFGMNPSTYTRCSETVSGGRSVFVGAFGDDGLIVQYAIETLSSPWENGVAALRKFS